MFGGFSQLTTTAEHYFVVWTVHSDLITARSAVVGGWEEPPNIWLTVAKSAFVGWALNVRVRMLLKGAVTSIMIRRRDRNTNIQLIVKQSLFDIL